MYAAEGRVRCQYELLGAEHQFDDPRRGGSHDQQAAAGAALHGFSGWEFSELGRKVKLGLARNTYILARNAKGNEFRA